MQSRNRESYGEAKLRVMQYYGGLLETFGLPNLPSNSYSYRYVTRRPCLDAAYKDR